MKTKTAFVPSTDCLEPRIAMSGGIHHVHGLPVLTPHALSEVWADVSKAFKTFATKRENYNLLNHNLSKAVERIPYNVRDGLLATVQAEPSALQSDIASDVSHPLILELTNTDEEIGIFVKSEVQAGIFDYA